MRKSYHWANYDAGFYLNTYSCQRQIKGLTLDRQNISVHIMDYSHTFLKYVRICSSLLITLKQLRKQKTLFSWLWTHLQDLQLSICCSAFCLCLMLIKKNARKKKKRLSQSMPDFMIKFDICILGNHASRNICLYFPI